MANSDNLLEKTRVLVVDDERHIARFLEFVLNKAGYEVALAYTGEQALAAVEANVFGDDYLAALIWEHGHRSPTQMIDAIRADVTRLCQSDTFADDFTCVAVKIGEATVAPAPVQTSMELISDLTELARVRDFILRFC